MNKENINDFEIKVMSYNIRCLTSDDIGDRNWQNRNKLVDKIIKNNSPDVVGFQEVRKQQYEFLKSAMPEYENIMAYRDDSEASESTPVFFRKDKFELLEYKNFWLSSTPEVMSKDWGAKCYRICTMVKLRHKHTNREILVINTHLDHMSELARINGIKLVLNEINKHNVPALLMGDFNAEPGEETINFADKFMIDSGKGFEDFLKGTFNNYTHKDIEEYIKIDYIYLSPNSFNVKNYFVDYTTFDNVFPSDHFPICTVLKFK